MAPRGQGRILHLGAYVGKNPVEIVDAPKEDNGSQSRANWNSKTSQIKVSKEQTLVVVLQLLTWLPACNQRVFKVEMD